jgi:phosphoenolpyruvate carboxykinase (GTP)
MLPGQTIVGDDIAYFRKRRQDDGRQRRAGHLRHHRRRQPDDDPVIFEALNQTPGEVIFGNVLISDGKPYWMGMGQELPKGVNFQGNWDQGRPMDGKPVPPSHKNARYTIRLHALANLDPEAGQPQRRPCRRHHLRRPRQRYAGAGRAGVRLDRGHHRQGRVDRIGNHRRHAGQAGVRKFNIMANQDFVSIPLGQYIQNNLDLPMM